jgi:dihydroxyacetone kinase-like protein
MILTIKELKGLFTAWSESMSANKDFLIDLDSIVGDGDLGLTMSDGFAAAAVNSGEREDNDIGNLFYFAGKAMSVAVPSTMGTLMASGLMEIGKNLKKQTEFELYKIGHVFEYYMNGVMHRGKAKVGDKTFLDGLYPAVEVLKSATIDSDMHTILSDAAKAAAEGAENTTTMIAVHGRAAIRGEQSRALLDPGAVVAKILVETTSKYLISLL